MFQFAFPERIRAAAESVPRPLCMTHDTPKVSVVSVDDGCVTFTYISSTILLDVL